MTRSQKAHVDVSMPRTRSGTKQNIQALMADPLIRRTVQTIERHAMLHRGDKVLVGVSSGPDSVVLLHVLATLADELDVCLGIAHLDHGLRPQAAQAEENLVRSLARQFGLAIHAETLEGILPKGSMEEQLRLLRYSFFKRTAQAYGYTKVALGHHADDNAEAVLMHMLRGSGLRGLAGIPPVREKIIRPLIALRRSEILAYAERHGLSYMQDGSNLDPRFERNRIRHELIPLLERQYNPNLVQTLNRTASLCWEEIRWLDSQMAPLVADLTVRSDAQILELRLEQLRLAPRAQQRHLLRAALRQWQGHLRRIGAEHIETLLSLLNPPCTAQLHLPYHVIAEKMGALLRFRRVADARQASSPFVSENYHYLLPAVGQDPVELRIAQAQTVLRFSLTSPDESEPWQVPERHVILLDMDLLEFPLSVRNFKAGDFFQPFGLQGSQKIKKLFIDRKIPRVCRLQIPLLISGSSTILWVVGVRRGGQAAVSGTTARVLRVEAQAI